jgi:hypothetical protein
MTVASSSRKPGADWLRCSFGQSVFECLEPKDLLEIEDQPRWYWVVVKRAHE